MIIEFDSVKCQRNVVERNLSFERANEVDLEAALISRDERQNYGEDRYVALCHLDKRMHVLCFTETIRGIRVISFRKANKREVLHYEKKQATD
jgi:uncharacterized DUF497 family protein